MSSTTFRLQTGFGVPYKLMEGYPKFGWEDNGQIKATERYLIHATDLQTFAIESMPPPIIFNNLILRIPRRRLPGAPFLVTRSFSAEPHSGQKPGDPFSSDPDGNTAGAYDDIYALTIEYETAKPADFSGGGTASGMDPEEFLEASVSIGGQFLTWPSEEVKIADDGGMHLLYPGAGAADEAVKGFGAPIVKLICQMQIELKWKYVLIPPWQAILDNLGRLNPIEYRFLLNSEPETVMFMGVSGQQRFIWSGPTHQVWGPFGRGVPIGTPWDLTYKFNVQRINEDPAIVAKAASRIYGWNHSYFPKKSKWCRVKRADGSPLYRTGEFTSLFKAGTLL